jgi:cytochrome c-type biogenesis protein CcmH/NrfF
LRTTLAVAAVLAAMSVALYLRAGPDPNAVPTADEAASRFMSPYCEGLTLEECPHPKSRILRARIEAMISNGVNNRGIDRWMVANYGQTALGSPTQSVAWLVPMVVAAGGLVLVMSRLRREKLHRQPPDLSELSEAARAQVNRDLASFAGGSDD